VLAKPFFSTWLFLGVGVVGGGAKVEKGEWIKRGNRQTSRISLGKRGWSITITPSYSPSLVSKKRSSGRSS